jgi:hypothetical protein
MYNNYDNSPNLMISIGSVVFSQQKNSSTNCSKGDIEDEKHFIVDCPLYENIRVKFFDKVTDLCPNFRYMDTSSKCVWLFTMSTDSYLTY